MDQSVKLLDKKIERVLYELYKSIFSYLDFPTLINALTVSTEFYNLLNKYFKHFLVTKNLLDVNDTQVSGDHYLKLFRAYYSREVLISDLPNEKNSCDEMKFVRFPRCSTYGVKDFTLGVNFAVFHLYNNDIIFLKTEEYTNPTFNMKSINKKNLRHNVSKFFTNAPDLFYLTVTGQLHVVFFNPEVPSYELQEGLLEITMNKPLKDCAFSFYHGLLFFQAPELGQEKEKHVGKNQQRKLQDIRHLSLEALILEDFNTEARLKKINGLDYLMIRDFCLAAPSALFISENKEVFECNFLLLNNGEFYTTIFEPFKEKTITKVWCGYNYYFALEQKELESIDKWSQKEILEWVLEKNFQKYRNAIKNHNLNGERLLKADKQFLADQLGMTKEVQIKFLDEINKVSKKTYQKPKLYGWGKNNFGKLALNTGNMYVQNPTEVLMPELSNGDEIEMIECGSKCSAILTSQGNVWISEPFTKKAPKEEEVKHDHSNKRNKKDPIDPLKDKDPGKGTSRWFNLNPKCQKLRDGRRYRIMKISFGKDKVAVLGANLGYKKNLPSQESENKTSFSKLKVVEQVYFRILWDKQLSHDDFTVGYDDRFLGMIEISFLDFSSKVDVSPQKIKFIKRKGNLIWDSRIKSIDLIPL